MVFGKIIAWGARGIKRLAALNPKARRAVVIAAAAALVLLLSACTAVTLDAMKSRTINLRMENIGELNTQAAYYTNVQVIRNAREVFGVEVPFTQSHYIYSYDGVIKAGVDFSQITAVENALEKTITVTMPRAAITSNDVDENSLEIYDESRNLFTPLTLTDLQSSRVLMEQEAEKTAVQNGLLAAADSNARLLLENFLLTDPAHADYQILFVEVE